MRDLIEADLRHLWHPFTHHGLWGGPDDPVVVIERAEGNELVDTEGRRYLDAISSLWCNTLGHRVPAIDDAIRAQLERVAHSTLLGLSSRPAIELAAKLAALCPGDLERVFFTDAGATAVEVALKIAVQRARLVEGDATPRRHLLALDDAYHGDTMGAVSLGFSPGFHRAFEHLAFPVGRLPRDVDGAIAAIRAAGAELCAVVLEPLVQGAAGMLVQPPGFLAAVAEATRAAGALLICDEVATGFWRTGRRFACEHEGVVPDLLCLAKGLTGGYLPLAATVVTPAVFEPFATGRADGARTLFHGHTYTGNALGCAAALAAVDELERLAARGRVAALEQRLARALAPLADHPHVLEVRRRGFMVGVELVADKEGPRRFARAQRVGHKVAHHGRDHGVLLRPLGDVMVLMPPFSFSDEEVERAVAAVQRGIDAICPEAARTTA
ncbi:MAG: adenosylmethionine--8-amino-7-oxononanoate transaminase [Deltaproteobacteria bacterium]|nr:adenosylmethionine--8-amino-7-oxononanoate transaminase [Deltaproteobacteria bacterium]